MERQNLDYVNLFLFELDVLFLLVDGSVEYLQVMWLILYDIFPFCDCEAPVYKLRRSMVLGNSRHSLEAIFNHK